MPKDGQATKRKKTKTQGLYDRIADVQNLAMKINGYRVSVAKYFQSLDLDVGPDSLVLDAGSGTGIVTLAFQDAGFRPRGAIALDLSFNSLKVAREEFTKRKRYAKRTDAVQGNILKLPFPDDTFDLVLMCGVLEYTPLDDGLRESARILKKGARLVLLPVKPSVVGTVLELLYNFKIHPLENVREAASRYFNIIDNCEFPMTEPIGWSKTIFLLEKK
ncbi:MAG: class I SAM-dependent methyltransferase [Pyrinomonadaceae bacterium]